MIELNSCGALKEKIDEEWWEMISWTGCLASVRRDKARSHYTFDTGPVTLVAIHSTCNIQTVPSCL